MRRVGQKNTGPEIVVRRTAHRLGYRFRLHDANLPGKPDLVFPGRQRIIFVHGCFWHGHNCSSGTLPKSNTEFWAAKIERNRLRDATNNRKLRRQGWKILTIWQCKLRDSVNLERKLHRFLTATPR